MLCSIMCVVDTLDDLHMTQKKSPLTFSVAPPSPDHCSMRCGCTFVVILSESEIESVIVLY